MSMNEIPPQLTRGLSALLHKLPIFHLRSHRVPELHEHSHGFIVRRECVPLSESSVCAVDSTQGEQLSRPFCESRALELDHVLEDFRF